METKQGRFRSWIEANKTWLEVSIQLLGVALLGTASIVIACQANRIATTQTELAEYQNSLVERPNLPTIKLWARGATDEFGKPYTALEFVNTGGRVVEFHSRQISFLLLSKPLKEGEATRLAYWYMFLPLEWHLGDGSGRLATYRACTPSLSNPPGACESRDSYLRTLLASPQGPDPFNVQACVFFWVSYRDLYGKEYERLLLWTPFSPLLGIGHGYSEIPVEFAPRLSALKYHHPIDDTGLPSLEELKAGFGDFTKAEDIFGEDEQPGSACVPARLLYGGGY